MHAYMTSAFATIVFVWAVELGRATNISSSVFQMRGALVKSKTKS